MIDTSPMTFGQLLRAPFLVVWFVLIGATLVSWYLGADHGVRDHHLTTVLIMLVMPLMKPWIRERPAPVRIPPMLPRAASARPGREATKEMAEFTPAEMADVMAAHAAETTALIAAQPADM